MSFLYEVSWFVWQDATSFYTMKTDPDVTRDQYKNMNKSGLFPTSEEARTMVYVKNCQTHNYLKDLGLQGGISDHQQLYLNIFSEYVGLCLGKPFWYRVMKGQHGYSVCLSVCPQYAALFGLVNPVELRLLSKYFLWLFKSFCKRADVIKYQKYNLSILLLGSELQRTVSDGYWGRPRQDNPRCSVKCQSLPHH